MKILKIALCSLALILLIYGRSYFSTEETIVMAVDEWGPLISRELRGGGVLTRIISESFASEGIKVELKWMPGPRQYYQVKIGKCDLSPGWAKTPEREAEMLYSSDYVAETYKVFYHLKSFPFDWTTMDDLKGLRIGGQIGNDYGDDFNQAEKERRINVIRIPNNDQNFKKLAVGRIDILPVGILVGQWEARKNLTAEQYAAITYHPKGLTAPRGSYVVFTKNEKGARLVGIFNRGLAKLKASGKYDNDLTEIMNGKYE